MEFRNVKTLVIGSGISGIGAVSLLGRMGADIILFDGSDKVTAEDLQDKLNTELSGQSMEYPPYCIAGELPAEAEEQVEAAV